MRSFYKRTIISFLILILIFIFALGGCSSSSQNDDQQPDQQLEGLIVEYVDVGQGDCIIIRFPDKKSMMIDCGPSEDYSIQSVINALTSLEINHLDYLVLTHPDQDHVGGAVAVLNAVSVGTAYIPNVLSPTIFPSFNSAVNLLKEKNVKTVISDNTIAILGEEYSATFLAPAPKSNKDSSYIDFNISAQPTETQTNNISAVIYLEYKGVRFLFTGDAGIDAERKVLSDYNSGKIDHIFSYYGVNVNLSNIDFLKVAHHGSQDSCCQDFLDLICPKNAVISVGGNNFYGHPSTNTLNRIFIANPNCSILRTDVCGSITVNVDLLGSTKVVCQR